MMAEVTRLIRWVIRSDDKSILAIDDCGYVEPWSQADLLSTLKNRSVIGIVAEDEKRRVVGYCVYQLDGYVVRILRMAVEPRERRNGVATAMIDRLKDKLCNHRRSTIVIDVDGRQLFAQLMLARCGFLAEVLPEDGIRFVFMGGKTNGIP